MKEDFLTPNYLILTNGPFIKTKLPLIASFKIFMGRAQPLLHFSNE